MLMLAYKRSDGMEWIGTLIGMGIGFYKKILYLSTADGYLASGLWCLAGAFLLCSDVLRFLAFIH